MSEQPIEYDLLWKDVITEMFEEFLLFFAPKLYEQVDFSTPPQFLEQELQTIIPESDSQKRISDKLVKLLLRNGQEQWVFVHIEVQGSYDKTFPTRMFQYFYRVLDKFDQPIFSLALFTDKSSKYNQNEFHYNFHGTSVTYRFNTYRIASQSEEDLQQSANPFAIAVLAGLYSLQSRHNTDLKFKYKRHLMKLILQDKIKERDIKRQHLQKLFIFIDHLMRLSKEAETSLAQELKPLIESEEEIMALSWESTSFARIYKEEAMQKGKEEGLAEGRAKGLEEGREKGLAEGKAEGIELGEKQKALEIAQKLLIKGFSLEEVAEDTGLSIHEISQLK